jgi:hypothetical protein
MCPFARVAHLLLLLLLLLRSLDGIARQAGLGGRDPLRLLRLVYLLSLCLDEDLGAGLYREGL